MAATGKPSGLTVARNNGVFTCSWKIPSGGYGAGQQFQYRYKKNSSWTKWYSVAVGTTVTKKSVTLSASNFYPNAKKPALARFDFRVRGKKANDNKGTYTWSAWTSGTYDIQEPERPTLTAELSNEFSNATDFEYKVKTSNTANRWYTQVQWQTMLVAESGEADGAKLNWSDSADGWNAGTRTATDDTIRITEDSSAIAEGSHTRWLRIRARGPQGASAWTYARHVYAVPMKAEYSPYACHAWQNDDNSTMTATVTWDVYQNSGKNPIDKVEVEYVIATPADAATLSCPVGASWKKAVTVRDTSWYDAVTFNVDSIPGEDKALYVRVNTIHDRNTTYGDAYLLWTGHLKQPTNVSVTTNASTHRARVTATNTCTIPGTNLAVEFRRESSMLAPILAIIPNGSSSVTFNCPDWGTEAISFGVFAFSGTYTPKQRTDGLLVYVIGQGMNSPTVYEGGDVPMPPSDVTVSATSIPETIRVTWDWTWSEATAAEISWADHEDAWESTDAPSKYVVDNIYTSAWNISGVENGKRWYVRVRLMKGETFGAYSDIKSIDLSSAPLKPAMSLSAATIQEGDAFTAYWSYMSSDTTAQAYATICTATVSGGVITYGDEIAHTQTAQHIDLTALDEWATGNTYLLCLKVVSASGHESEWSDPVAISIAEPLTCVISASSLEEVTISSDDVEGTTRTVLALTEMPLTLTVTGAGTGGTTTVIIERASDYIADRPNETQFNGYEGETVAIYSQLGEFEIQIDEDVLVGLFDDGAQYRIIATVQDGLGQSAEETLEFEVHWAHQAVAPTATVTLDGSIAQIRATRPQGAIASDVCDIYRLSADRPVLIVEDGSFGQTYVDPYPAINGGYRAVLRTANGDYITADDSFAWVDIESGFDADYNIIDFNGEQIYLRYNLTLNNAWRKDFTETVYLGGSVQGDWNPAVQRTLSANSVSITSVDPDTIEGLRRLAVYPGICHVRTVDGSSFDADIQVSESRSYQAGKKVDFDLSITRVDPEGLDGMTLEEWTNGLE